MLKKSSFGFTLIELMVALTVLAMLLAMAGPSFSSFIQNRKIRTTAEAVLNGLNLAKSEAVRRNTSISFVLDAAGGWTVGCTTVVGTDCPASIQAKPSAEGSTNITTSAVNLTFNGYGRVTSLVAGTNATIDVTNPLGLCETEVNGSMRCLRVVVTPGGQVRMCDPKSTVTNPTSPQAC